jgi:hypothetical protein
MLAFSTDEYLKEWEEKVSNLHLKTKFDLNFNPNSPNLAQI